MSDSCDFCTVISAKYPTGLLICLCVIAKYGGVSMFSAVLHFTAADKISGEKTESGPSRLANPELQSPQMDQISTETGKAQRSCLLFQEICGSCTAENLSQCILCGWRRMFRFSWCVLCIFSPFYLLSQGILSYSSSERARCYSVVCVRVSEQERKSQIWAGWGKKSLL